LGFLGHCFGHVALSSHKELEYLKYIVSRIDPLSLRIDLKTASRLGDISPKRISGGYSTPPDALIGAVMLEMHISLIN